MSSLSNPMGWDPSQSAARWLRAELERLVAAIAPWLLELSGVGPISAAQVLVSWSHASSERSPDSCSSC
jgi:transposase